MTGAALHVGRQERLARHPAAQSPASRHERDRRLQARRPPRHAPCLCAERVAAASQPDARDRYSWSLAAVELPARSNAYAVPHLGFAKSRAAYLLGTREQQSARRASQRCCGRAVRASRRHRRAPASVARHSPAKVVIPPCSPRVLARASVRAAANDGAGHRVRRPSQGGMRIRAGVAPAAARLESSRYRFRSRLRVRDWRSAVLISAPSWFQGSGRLRGFGDTDTWIDRDTTSSTAVQRRGAGSSLALRPYGP
jgi:hypothetical protein